MRITLDKDFTSVSSVDVVKEGIKEFKARYTDNDIRTFIMDEYAQDLGGEILKLDMKAWHDTIDKNPENTVFYVSDMIIDTYYGFKRVYGVAFNLDFQPINRNCARFKEYGLAVEE